MFFLVHCCFMSTETVGTNRDEESRTPTSPFTQLLRSERSVVSNKYTYYSSCSAQFYSGLIVATFFDQLLRVSAAQFFQGRIGFVAMFCNKLLCVSAAQFFQGRISFVDTFSNQLLNTDSEDYKNFVDDVRQLVSLHKMKGLVLMNVMMVMMTVLMVVVMI